MKLYTSAKLSGCYFSISYEEKLKHPYAVYFQGQLFLLKIMKISEVFSTYLADELIVHSADSPETVFSCVKLN